ncbi:c-type cytochrome [Aquabacterium humicola]|uniref:c-type cytochrome n=1 Tax=Aquabacterium humicola TaxID=3237377 RepID=UPI0032EB93F1
MGMKHLARAAALATGLGLAAFAPAAQADTEADLNKAGCMACHAKDKKLVGPAFKEIAAKNKGQANVVATLADKVRKGGKGVYGQIPMPPNPVEKIGDAELKMAVEWILKQ